MTNNNNIVMDQWTIALPAVVLSSAKQQEEWDQTPDKPYIAADIANWMAPYLADITRLVSRSPNSVGSSQRWLVHALPISSRGHSGWRTCQSCVGTTYLSQPGFLCPAPSVPMRRQGRSRRNSWSRLQTQCRRNNPPPRLERFVCRNSPEVRRKASRWIDADPMAGYQMYMTGLVCPSHRHVLKLVFI